MKRFGVWIALGLATGCHPLMPLSQAPAPSATPAKPSPCKGDAKLEEGMAQVPRIRASWFPDPAGGARLYVLEAGPERSKHPPLLLIHGVGPAGLGDFSKVMTALSKHRRVIGVDLPGFGHSERHGDAFGPERLVDAADAVVRACAPGKIDVLGHSSGGALALLFAAKRHDVVRRLIAVDAAGILRPGSLLRGQLHSGLRKMREDSARASKVVEKVGDAVIALFGAILPSAESVTDTGLLGKGPSMLAATALLDFNFGPAISQVRSPTLIIWGERDEVMPSRIGQLLDDRIADSELVFVKNAGHLPMDDAPDEFVSLVDHFLDSKVVHRDARTKKNRATRIGTCKDQNDLTLTGDYAEITIEDCKNVWLNHVRATRVVIRNSQIRLDHTQVSAGLVVEDSNLSVTGGELKGEIALTLNQADVDLAGVLIKGEKAAVLAQRKSQVSFSVTPIESPHGKQILQEERDLKDAEEL